MDVVCDADYILGHDDVERRRLNTQAAFMEPLTRRALLAAGLRPGMHVLDVGAGFGDVTLLAASLVGSRGSVVGIEREGSAVAAATARAAAVGAVNVRFVAGDARNAVFDERFDAVIGRFVLMYLADPIEALTSCVGAVRAGGLVAFQEWHAVDPFTSTPTVELWDRTGALLVSTFRAAGTNLTMGLELRACFEAAGLLEPQLRAERLVGGGQSFGGYGFLADIIRSIAPAIERTGHASAADLDIDTLEAGCVRPHAPPAQRSPCRPSSPHPRTRRASAAADKYSVVTSGWSRLGVWEVAVGRRSPFVVRLSGGDRAILEERVGSRTVSHGRGSVSDRAAGGCRHEERGHRGPGRGLCGRGVSVAEAVL